MSNHWGYDGEEGPEHWHKMFPCAAGKHQTPIDIQSDQAVFDPKLAQVPLTFTYDRNCFKNVENTGHGLNVTGLSDASSSVQGGPLSHEHKFLQFHFHWGTTDNEGSEHLVDGKHFPTELHIVNWNSQLYSSPGEAVQSNKHDGLIVLGILFKIGRHNNELQKIVDHLGEITLKGQKASLNETLDLSGLFPSVSNYWAYQGSLTTPPCTECVQWVVFKEPVEISSEQVSSFRKIYSCSEAEHCNETTRISKNFRPVCDLNGRTVSKSFE